MASAANFSCFNSNLSKEFITPSVWSLNPIVRTDTGSRYAITAIIMLLFIIGLPSNILVIAVVLKKKLYTKQPTIILLLNLAVTDILVCIFVMPLNAATLIAGEFNFGGDDHTRCQVCQTGIIFVTLSLVTLNNLAILSVDRFIYVKAAMRYSMYVTNTKVILATILVWLFSITVTLPTLFGFNEMRFSTAIGLCTIAFSGSTHVTKNSYYLIFLAVVVLIPIATLVVTNAWGMCIIHNHIRSKSKKLKEEKSTHRKSFHEKLERQHNNMQTKLVKIYSAIFITNLITYLPIVARFITGVAAEKDEFTQAVRISGSIAYIALLSQSVVHPIVQTFLVAHVRKGITAQLSEIKDRVRKFSRNEVSDLTVSIRSNMSAVTERVPRGDANNITESISTSETSSNRDSIRNISESDALDNTEKLDIMKKEVNGCHQEITLDCVGNCEVV